MQGYLCTCECQKLPKSGRLPGQDCGRESKGKGRALRSRRTQRRKDCNAWAVCSL